MPEQRHFDRLHEQQLLQLLQLNLCVQCIECVDCPDAALMYLTIVARNDATRKDTAAYLAIVARNDATTQKDTAAYLTIVARNDATRKDTATPQISYAPAPNRPATTIRIRLPRTPQPTGRAAAALSRVPRWGPAVGLRAVMCAA